MNIQKIVRISGESNNKTAENRLVKCNDCDVQFETNCHFFAHCVVSDPLMTCKSRLDFWIPTQGGIKSCHFAADWTTEALFAACSSLVRTPFREEHLVGAFKKHMCFFVLIFDQPLFLCTFFWLWNAFSSWFWGNNDKNSNFFIFYKYFKRNTSEPSLRKKFIKCKFHTSEVFCTAWKEWK